MRFAFKANFLNSPSLQLEMINRAIFMFPFMFVFGQVFFPTRS